MSGAHRFGLRVYYEDTDLAGIVYYANYLRFIERARTEWVRGLGIDQGRLRDETGVVFAVRRIAAEYLAPARFDDRLEVRTVLRRVAGARIVLGQDVLRAGNEGGADDGGDGAVLFASEVTLVALGRDGRAARLPAEVRARLAGQGPAAGAG